MRKVFYLFLMIGMLLYVTYLVNFRDLAQRELGRLSAIYQVDIEQIAHASE